MKTEEIEIFCPQSVEDWRKWLEKNHHTAQSVWLVSYSKKSGKATITWSESVDVALCFGWIDSKKIKIDENTSQQFFSKRKARSTWSRINKEKIALLTENGLMTKAGMEVVETAKQNGSWSILDSVEDLVIPDDLEKAFSTRPGSRDFFQSLSKSIKKMILSWIVLARQPETRNARILEIAERAEKQLKPRHM